MFFINTWGKVIYKCFLLKISCIVLEIAIVDCKASYEEKNCNYTSSPNEICENDDEHRIAYSRSTYANLIGLCSTNGWTQFRRANVFIILLFFFCLFFLGKLKSERERKKNGFGVVSFVVDSIEWWLSSFSGVPCPRDSDRAAQVCHNYTLTNFAIAKKLKRGIMSRIRQSNNQSILFDKKKTIFQNLVFSTVYQLSTKLKCRQ